MRNSAGSDAHFSPEMPSVTAMSATTGSSSGGGSLFGAPFPAQYFTNYKSSPKQTTNRVEFTKEQNQQSKKITVCFNAIHGFLGFFLIRTPITELYVL